MTSTTRGMSLNRRTFLAMLGATGAAAAVGPVFFPFAADGATATPIDPAFPHGIAAGDPLPDGAVIWSRIDPAADPGSGVEVTWEVAATPDFATILQTGTISAETAADHTVRVLVQGLDPDGWFHYRFRYQQHTSRTGRLRTAPAPGAANDRLRFAFCSCQQINDSIYVAHAAMAADSCRFMRWVRPRVAPPRVRTTPTPARGAGCWPGRA